MRAGTDEAIEIRYEVIAPEADLADRITSALARLPGDQGQADALQDLRHLERLARVSREALAAISRTDYRGNEPTERQIARDVLREWFKDPR